jgi:hypothetical protein
MAFVVPTKRGAFEVRESHHTGEGPRSRTLATFRELTDEVVEKVREKATTPPTREQLREAARRAGAPVAPTPADRAARELIAELARGRDPDPKLRRLLAGALGGDWTESASAPSLTRSAAEWIATSPQQRGKALVDLLLLADALPSGGRRGKPLSFPGLRSTPA